MTRPKKRIGVVGNIGAGKTLVSRLISSFFDFDLKEEVVNKEILDLYYSNMKKYAFPTQMFFLSTRYQNMLKMEANPRSAVIDRIMDEDVWIFSKQLMIQEDMSKKDYEIIKSIYYNMTASLTELDLTIYLRTDPEVSKDRIRRRYELDPNRLNETSLIDPNNPYLEQLHQRYEERFKEEKYKNLMIIDTNNLMLADENNETPFYHGDIIPTLEEIKDRLYTN
ncbi:MAG: deoxynucleoside kinase [Nanoarchaeota archaeon]|nr:deoxynucleoside kinase [Nanoarchaeota archaeon]MBU1854735.1 deoxynucleoside kinase [Nanoarchaeota archaeon]